MSVLESQWWMLELPPEWQAEQDDEMIVITDSDGVGEIAITTLEKDDGAVGAEDLRQFTEDLASEYGAGESISVAGIDGLYYAYQEEGAALREWYLAGGELLILITYACDPDNTGMDDSAVDEILDTLALRAKQ